MNRLFRKLCNLASQYFPFWVLLAALIGLKSPNTFLWVLPHIPLLLGVIMLGMGMTLQVEDLREVLRRPKQVFIGTIAQYTIMPLFAYGLAVLFQLPPDLAVGVILVGSCPGGTASNVITFLARGDVALSVAMTSVSTLISPIMTPLLTLWFAGQWIEIPTGNLLLSILKIVWVPVILGILLRRFFESQVEQVIPVMPLISVSAIVVIVGAVVGVNAEKLVNAAAIVFLVIIIHNLLGLILGYRLGKFCQMPEKQCRTIAIEVGMQNSGLAVSLALSYFQPLAAIPGAIFSVWHNISGPLLATYWSSIKKID
jgi:BASS family bile acid:Na+ symporter